ncbi:MAG: single-stranded DNA-binding protein [Actinobacteria bacterium]|nr:single-stranded DNA-binding protein [Actinomycetota bacterium]
MSTETQEPAADLLEKEGDAAADYLEGLLDIADLDGDIDIDVEGDRAQVSIVEINAGELKSLVGDDGKVLDALQELARLAAAQATGERSRLMLDIAGFRLARRRDLEALAQTAIDEVTETGEPVRLAAMNAFERKIVHDVVTNAGLVSESEGVDPDRRIVIKPAS